jgi:hypothetical protein
MLAEDLRQRVSHGALFKKRRQLTVIAGTSLHLELLCSHNDIHEMNWCIICVSDRKNCFY